MLGLVQGAVVCLLAEGDAMSHAVFVLIVVVGLPVLGSMLIFGAVIRRSERRAAHRCEDDE